MGDKSPRDREKKKKRAVQKKVKKQNVVKSHTPKETAK